MPAACEACSGAHQAEPQKEEVAYALDKPQPYEIAVAAHSHGLKSELTAGEFSVALDAGFALGGKQTAPSPVQAFISSIVACTQVSDEQRRLGGSLNPVTVRWRWRPSH